MIPGAPLLVNGRTVLSRHPGTHSNFEAYRSQMLVDRSADSALVCADNLLDLLTVLEDQEGGHGANAEFLRDVRHLVDINLVEVDAVLVLFFLRHGAHFGGNHLARSAPGGEAVDEDDAAGGGLLDGGVEGGVIC